MKKLMIAAAAVALAGVTFADCDTPVECAFAYRIKLAGKTVVGKQASYVFDKVACDYVSDCWAKPASYRLAGYIYGATAKDGEDDCAECGCNDFSENTAIFWDANKVQQFEDVTSVTFDTLDILRNGGLKNKAQIAFKLGDLQLAGFGVFNPVSKKLKSANGFFAGTLDAPKCAGAYNEETCEYGEAVTAQVFAPCALDAAKDAEKAIAYGRWSLTYRQDKVDDYSKNGNIKVFQPTGFKSAEGGTEETTEP